VSRRELWLTAAGLFILALGVRVAAAAAITFPVPEDTAYYVGVARNLVQGHGLVSDAIWSYQLPPLSFPRPAFEVWLPLPTLLAAIPMTLLGATFRSGQVAAVLIGALVPVLAWRVAADAAGELALPSGRARMVAIGSGVVAVVLGPLAVHGVLTDSTMPFTALALVACLLMVRLLREPRGARWADPRLLGLGVALGVGAWTRNEALWVALVWAALAWWDRSPGTLSRRARLRWIVVPAAVAGAIFVPWMLRDWAVFGTPLPGQAAANALSTSGFDIFAWHDLPTLSRYLAQGPTVLFQDRVGALWHNLFEVLVVPGIPTGLVGLIALPWFARLRALRPLLLLSVVTFAVTTLAFPVSTLWGTFLHAAGPVHVLLLVTALLGLDALIAAVGRRLGWTRPVAWLGPAAVLVLAVPVAAISVGAIGAVSREAEQRYADLQPRLAAAGLAPGTAGPIVADFPIWVAESYRTSTLALPDESPASVLDLARNFGARTLVVTDTHGRWPHVLDARGPDAACFRPLDLADPSTGKVPSSLETTHAYRIACP